MKIPNGIHVASFVHLSLARIVSEDSQRCVCRHCAGVSLARIVSEDSQPYALQWAAFYKSSKDS